MSPSELRNKIFTFDQQLAMSGDLTQITKENQVMNKLIKSVKCMWHIDEECVPTFRFFQFKKSIIKEQEDEEEQVMLSFQDISHKILADTSKAESELLSLINSTISHEMRNPLNSIINQCKIVYSMC